MVSHVHLCLGSFEQPFQIDTLGPLDWQTECTIPDQLRKRAQSSADAEDRRVIKCLLEAIVVEEHA